MDVYSSPKHLIWFFILTGLLSCNKPPETSVSRKFGEGNIDYVFSGKDEDGYVKHIEVMFNGLSSVNNFDDGSSHSIQIIQGVNSVEARACDDRDKLDKSPLKFSFTPLDVESAETLIDGIFDEKKDSYSSLEKDVLLSVGATSSFLTDYLVTLESGKNAVVNYVGHDKDLEGEISNKGILDLYGIKNLYLFRVPGFELDSKLRTFIEGGFGYGE